MERLVKIADEVGDELERGGAVGAIEREVGEPLFPLGDAIDGAIAPAIRARAAGDPGLPRTIAIAIVAGRVCWNI